MKLVLLTFVFTQNSFQFAHFLFFITDGFLEREGKVFTNSKNSVVFSIAMSNGVPGPSTTSATCEKIVNELAEVEKPTGTPPPNEMENNNVVAASPKALSSAGEARFPIDVDVLKNVQQQDGR